MSKTFPKQFMYSMHQMYSLIQKHMERKLTEAKTMSFSQFWVLICFVECKSEGDQTASEVAKKMYISEATLSGHIERLLKSKLVTRKIDPQNRRKSIINLTDKGRKQFEVAKKIISHEFNVIFDPISESDGKHMLQNFDKILKELTEKK